MFYYLPLCSVLTTKSQIIHPFMPNQHTVSMFNTLCLYYQPCTRATKGNATWPLPSRKMAECIQAECHVENALLAHKLFQVQRWMPKLPGRVWSGNFCGEMPMPSTAQNSDGLRQAHKPWKMPLWCSWQRDCTSSSLYTQHLFKGPGLQPVLDVCWAEPKIFHFI